MNYENIKKGLSERDKSEVEIYVNYLKFLETEKDRDQKIKNKWFSYFTEKQAIDIYNKVAKDGLFIDGETITLGYRGKILVTYNYQAYKNLVLKIYPETTFDLQIVNDGDTYSFSKDSGRVTYHHSINEPFKTNKAIIGAYCVIKNNRGEFIEVLNMDDINKMKAVAKTTKIWDAWLSEMVLKSTMKRACKRHFKDIVTNLESLDNENYDLDAVNVEIDINSKINSANTFDELNKIYKENVNVTKDKVNFIRLLGERKEELKELLPNYSEENESEVLQILKKEGKFDDALLLKYKFTDDQRQDLISKAI